MTLDPDAARLIDALRSAARPPLSEIPLEEIRAGVIPVPGPPMPMGSVEDRLLEKDGHQVPVRIYEPLQSGNVGTTVFFHGGGWVMGSLESHDALARQLCHASSHRVVAVEYRLAPEHPYPAALDDAMAAVHWVAESLAGPVAVCGDSSGGNLAASTCLMARDQQGPQIVAQALIYPVTDSRLETASCRENICEEMLSREDMQWFWHQYCPDSALARSPYLSPLNGNLSGLPPALVLMAECDVLRDEVQAYADALQHAGVRVERIHCEGLIHGFMRRLHLFRRAADYCGQIGEFLNRHLRTAPIRE